MVIVIVFLLSTVLSFEIKVYKSGEGCFGTDIEKHTLYVAEVSAKNTKDQVLNIDVVDPRKNFIFNRHLVNGVTFSFTSVDSGSHELCVRNLADYEIFVSIDIKTGAMAKDYSTVASTKVLQEADTRIERIKESAKMIHNEIKHLRTREEELRQTNDTIHSRVIAYSISSILLLVIVAGVQALYIKRYFKDKKMI